MPPMVPMSPKFWGGVPKSAPNFGRGVHSHSKFGEGSQVSPSSRTPPQNDSHGPNEPQISPKFWEWGVTATPNLGRGLR
ncbi:hypothetical protein DV515_00019515 [Chloebia gouldiae]|uniref:Uncharacterized protein n=1 Tax=Chloebia gouldiae TaxID=44316 RepID=A0A3L8Q4I7_CHLGU|nr:hypothetical protein DV515_00019515 [Chloebia gouldiae]